MLPHRVVGVLHVERCENRGVSNDACGVRRDEICRKGSQGPAVEGDVVDDDDQYVSAGVLAHQHGPNRQIRTEIEPTRRELRRRRVHTFGSAVALDGELHVGERSDDLARAVGAVDVDRSKHLMACNDVRKRLLECIAVDVSGDPDRERNVVDRGLRVEAIDEPQPLLRGGER